MPSVPRTVRAYLQFRSRWWFGEKYAAISDLIISLDQFARELRKAERDGHSFNAAESIELISDTLRKLR